jgi:hypothetical protein
MQLFQRSNSAIRSAVARFDAWTSQHRTVLRTLRHVFCCALLFGGVAHAAYHSALAQSAQASCGEMCLAIPGFFVIAAAAYSSLAVLAALAYAAVLHALKRPPPTDGDFIWIVTGFILAQFGALWGAHSYARPEFFLAWCMGGAGAVDFFWSRFAGNPGAGSGAAVAHQGGRKFSWWLSVG